MRSPILATPLPQTPQWTDQDIRRSLAKVGKETEEDELNCGGCGYESCRDFALALLNEKSEPAMCISFLRRQANRKANALLRSMPSGVVIVDKELKIIESNQSFGDIIGGEAALIQEAVPGMMGASLKRLIPFGNLFTEVLATDTEVRKNNIHLGHQLVNIIVFPIEPGETVGGLLFDVAIVEERSDNIAFKAREVIDKNLTTVQDIACRLGEHMAETEILLRSIADGYGKNN